MEELAEFARKSAPKIVDIELHQENDFIRLGLKHGEILTSEYAIPKAGDVRSAIDNRITKYGLRLASEVIDHFQLENEFMERYKDKNVLLAVRTNVEASYDKHARKSIPSFGKIWESFVEDRVPHKNTESIEEYLHGANERFKQLLFLRDQINYLGNVKQDLDAWFLLNLYISHFISLVKSLGDNLAWILKLFYNMGNLKKPVQIDLLKQKFQKELRTKNLSLYQTIYEKLKYNDFEKLKDFRDIIVHRHALHVSRVQFGRTGPTRILIPVDPTLGVVDPLRLKREAVRGGVAKVVVENRKSIVKYGLKEVFVWFASPQMKMPFDYPTSFCDRFLKFISEAYEKTYVEILREAGISSSEGLSREQNAI